MIPDASFEIDGGLHPHEAHYLKLDSSKAKALLEWQARWTLDTALNKVIEWNLQWQNDEEMRDCCTAQILSYCGEVG